MSVYPRLAALLDRAGPEVPRGAALVEYLQARADPARLTFICTHNSRRSHIAQLWAQAAAHHFGFDRVQCFSGGTATTRFNEHAIAALRSLGFRITLQVPTENPVYEVRFADDAPPVAAFSKGYFDPPNPREQFCAVMTCASADADCPFIPGADLRVSLPCDDPKESDGSGREAEVYRKSATAIGLEIAAIFAAARQPS